MLVTDTLSCRRRKDNAGIKLAVRRGLGGPGPWPGSTDNVRVRAWLKYHSNVIQSISGFHAPFFLPREHYLQLCSPYARDTITELTSSAEMCDAVCLLGIVQRVTMGLHLRVYWESPVRATNVRLTSDVPGAS